MNPSLRNLFIKKRSDHFGEHLLTNLRYDRLGPPLLAEVRHQKEQSCQPLLARIKKLVNQIFLDARVASQDLVRANREFHFF